MALKATVDHEAVVAGLEALTKFGAVTVRVVAEVLNGNTYWLKLIYEDVATVTIPSIDTGHIPGTYVTSIEVFRLVLEAVPAYVTTLDVDLKDDEVGVVFQGMSIVLTYTNAQ